MTFSVHFEKEVDLEYTRNWDSNFLSRFRRHPQQELDVLTVTKKTKNDIYF